MKGKLIPIPEENIGAALTALRVQIADLQSMAERHPAIKTSIYEDVAALTWLADNIQERPVVEIGDGH